MNRKDPSVERLAMVFNIVWKSDSRVNYCFHHTVSWCVQKFVETNWYEFNPIVHLGLSRDRPMPFPACFCFSKVYAARDIGHKYSKENTVQNFFTNRSINKNHTIVCGRCVFHLRFICVPFASFSDVTYLLAVKKVSRNLSKFLVGRNLFGTKYHGKCLSMKEIKSLFSESSLRHLLRIL